MKHSLFWCLFTWIWYDIWHPFLTYGKQPGTVSVFYFNIMSVSISVKPGRVNTYFYFILRLINHEWRDHTLSPWCGNSHYTQQKHNEPSELQWIVHTVRVTEACEIWWLCFIVVGLTYERYVNWGIAQKGQEEEERPKNTILSQKEERKEEDCWSIGSKTMKWVVYGC